MTTKLCPLKFANPAALVPHLPAPDMNCEREKCEWWVGGDNDHCAIVALMFVQEDSQQRRKK